MLLTNNKGEALTWDLEQLINMAQHAFSGPCDDWPNGAVLHVALGCKLLQPALNACKQNKIEITLWL